MISKLFLLLFLYGELRNEDEKENDIESKKKFATSKCNIIL
jgi:hypothetical protein